MLDNLRFMCTDPSGFNSVKYEYYEERFLSQYSPESSKSEIVIESEKGKLATPVEQPSYPIVSIDGPMDSAWPMQSHDTHHTGRSSYSTIDTCAEKWRFWEDRWIEAGCVIDNDGIIYFGDAWGDVIALFPDGTKKWKYTLDGQIMGSTPAIAEDGTIYVGAWDDCLYAINPDGTKKWKFNSGDNIASSPAISYDGTIYFGTMGEGCNIFAVNPNGTEKWRYHTGYYITSDPAIGDDGTVYCGSGDDYLYAIWPNGSLRWRYKTGNIIKGSPSLPDDGTIYIGSYDGYLHAVFPNNGTRKWRCHIGDGSETNPSIGPDGIIYIGGNYLYAIYPNGTLKWKFSLHGGGFIHRSYPAISADGIIYFGVDSGYFFAVNPDGTERFRKRISNWLIASSPAIGEDGTVYIGTTEGVGEGGYLYAFGVGELEADAHGPYYGLTNQPLQFTGASTGGYSPHSYHWDFGDTYTSEEQNPIHTYTAPGNYTVTFTVTDDEGDTAVDTTYAWIQTTNTAPNQPDIDGPISGNAGTSYPYTFVSTDPEGLQVWYYIDWGDETSTGWLGPYNSGVTITKSHKWTNQGTFTIKAKAKDPYNDEGPWGELQVIMPRNKATNNMLLLRLFEQFSLLREALLRLIPK